MAPIAGSLVRPRPMGHFTPSPNRLRAAARHSSSIAGTPIAAVLMLATVVLTASGCGGGNAPAPSASPIAPAAAQFPPAVDNSQLLDDCTHDDSGQNSQ